VIATLSKRSNRSNQSQTNLAAFPALNRIEKSIRGAMSTRTMCPSDGSNTPAAGINAKGRFGEAIFKLISAG
jgi:hypothetical protein